MDSVLFWEVAVLVATFMYNIALLNYVGKVLVGANRNLFAYALLSCANTFIVYFFSGHTSYYYLEFIALFGLLTIEFKLISKAPFTQAMFGASIVALHIACMHLPSVAFFSAILKIAPMALLSDSFYRYVILFMTVFFLSVALVLIEKLIPVRYIKRASLASPYTEILILSTLFVLSYLAFDAYCLVTDVYFPQQARQLTVIVLVSLALFYYLFLYTINFINLSMYKRQNDTAQLHFNEIEMKKKETSEKLATDFLTKLYNKKYVFDKFDEILNTSDLDFGLLFVDVNALKYVNDNFGHDKGDLYLVEIADSIRHSIRESDIAARISGDEFLVLLPDVGGVDDLNNIVARMKNEIDKTPLLEGFKLSASIGAIFVVDEEKPKGMAALLDFVDILMREDKKRFYSTMHAGKEEG